jgi:hypothetical protein
MQINAGVCQEEEEIYSCIDVVGVGAQLVDSVQMILFMWKRRILSSVTTWDESCPLVYLSRTAAYMRLAG